MTANTANTVTISVVGFVLALALIVVWRLVHGDDRIRRVRFGVFYERDRDEDELPRKDERP
jgi:hypothetical protein